MEADVLSYFCRIAAIDSESRDERCIVDALKADLEALGANVEEDDTFIKTGGNAGNIHALIPGSVEKAPILFCAHVDTVVPGKGVMPQVRDGKVFSDGTTVLGADDKSGVAEIIMGIKEVLDSGEEHAPVEILFTISEEVGLLGAKHFDKSKLKAAFGYAFDTQNVGDLVVGAPAQNSIEITIRGKEAHAGVEPDKGINAIRVASLAIAAMPLGRIDFETTSNVGVISGGMATNIVPNKVVIKGEARSHDSAKLDKITADMREAVENAVAGFQGEINSASFDFEVEKEYQAFRLDENAPAVSFAKETLKSLGIEAKVVVGGGGSDANIINAAGIPMIIVGTGMMRYHTVNEYIRVDDLEKGTRFVSQLIRLYTKAN